MMNVQPVVLFADHDLSWGRRARVELRRRGARVLSASSADEALRACREATPDLLILDEDLPGRRDRDVVELLQAECPDAAIVLLESETASPLRTADRGLLYSGPRRMARRLFMGFAETALGTRLKKMPEVCASRRILCVDDDEGYLESLARMLTRRGYEVSSFTSAERALEAIPWARPDLALIDIMMPGMGGLDLAGQIRSRSTSQIPMVFVTGLDSDEAHYEAHQQGASFMVSKAEAPERLLDVVDFLAGDLDDAEKEILKGRI